jgi:ribosome-associated protein
VIRVTATLAIDERDVSCTHIRAHGPGGQHVNKVSSAAQLQYDPGGVHPLPEDIRQRLKLVAGARMAGDGTIRITARRFRSLERNREDAYQRLVLLLQRAAHRQRPRKATRPTAASRRRRLEDKRRRSAAKQMRRRSAGEEP